VISPNSPSELLAIVPARTAAIRYSNTLPRAQQSAKSSKKSKPKSALPQAKQSIKFPSSTRATLPETNNSHISDIQVSAHVEDHGGYLLGNEAGNGNREGIENDRLNHLSHRSSCHRARRFVCTFSCGFQLGVSSYPVVLHLRHRNS
jgi:hypothetical protein